MAENINYKSKDGWVFKKSFCYDNNEDNCGKYGRYYARDVVTRVCPTGWHLPSKKDFEILINEVGKDSIAAKKLKSTNGWKNDKNGNDAFGFSAFPAGFRSYDWLNGEKFNDFSSAVFIWSSTEQKKNALDTNPDVYAFVLTPNNGIVLGLINRNWSLPVRCIKD